MGYHNEARKAYDERRNAIEALRSKVEEVGTEEVSEADAEFIKRSNSEIDRLDAVIDGALKGAETEKRSAELDALIGKAEPKVEERKLGRLETEVRSMLDLQVGQGTEFAMEERDLVSNVTGDGEELVPTSLFGTLYRGLIAEQTSMFAHGRTVVTSSGEQMDFPVMSTLSTAALIAEAGSIGESDPQFTTVSLNAYKYGLAIQLTPELLTDHAVGNAMAMVQAQAVEGIRKGVGAALLTADGSSKPNGVDNGSTTSTIGGVDGPTGDELIAAYHDIVEGYRVNAKWIFNDATVLGIRQLKDAGTNNYLWQPGLQAGSPDRLLGKPVFTDSNVAVAGANAKLGLFGDFQKGYLVRTVGSIRVERSTDYAFLNDLITFRFLGRFDGEILDNNAFTVLTNEAS